MEPRPDVPRVNWAEKITILITIVIAAIGGIQAFIYSQQKKLMADSISQAETQMRVSVRPWIGISDEVDAVKTSPIMFDKDGNASIQFAFLTRNFSTSAGPERYARGRVGRYRRLH
jgi:hypothetical protein